MSNAKRDDFAAALRAEIVGVLVRESGAPETHAIAMASKILQAVSHRWQGTTSYVRAPDRYDRAAVLRDLAVLPPAEVCRKHGISRWTVQRLRNRAIDPDKEKAVEDHFARLGMRQRGQS